MVRRPRITFRPGKALLELAKKLKVERMMLDKEDSGSSGGGGEDDRPVIE